MSDIEKYRELKYRYDKLVAGIHYLNQAIFKLKEAGIIVGTLTETRHQLMESEMRTERDLNYHFNVIKDDPDIDWVDGL